MRPLNFIGRGAGAAMMAIHRVELRCSFRQPEQPESQLSRQGLRCPRRMAESAFGERRCAFPPYGPAATSYKRSWNCQSETGHSAIQEIFNRIALAKRSCREGMDARARLV
jgi:hypothetical protein